MTREVIHKNLHTKGRPTQKLAQMDQRKSDKLRLDLSRREDRSSVKSKVTEKIKKTIYLDKIVLPRAQ